MDWAEFDRLSLEYKKKFNVHLPTELMPPAEFSRANEIMRECLASGKPYELPANIRRLMERGALF